VEGKEFTTWLENQLSLRGWRPVDLANAAGLPPPTIARVLNGDRKAGPDVANAIAVALNLSPEMVFRQAGLLPPEKNNTENYDPSVKELTDILRTASEAERREIVEYALWYLRRRKGA
jgi:transcriptional regulator with XRE-family HTH domain